MSLGIALFLTIFLMAFWVLLFLMTFVVPYWIHISLMDKLKPKKMIDEESPSE